MSTSIFERPETSGMLQRADWKIFPGFEQTVYCLYPRGEAGPEESVSQEIRIQADTHIRGFSIRGLPRSKKKIGKLKKYRVRQKHVYTL